MKNISNHCAWCIDTVYNVPENFPIEDSEEVYGACNTVNGDKKLLSVHIISMGKAGCSTISALIAMQ